MEKITAEVIKKFLLENDIELSSTHARLCVPIIDRIHRKMSVGIKFSEIKVDNGLICDGHHRYIASLLAKYKVDRIPSANTAIAVKWESVIFEDDDWDTVAKINMLNEQDANFNDIAINELIKLLK